MWKSYIIKPLTISLLALWLPAPLHACGFYFPNRILIENEQTFLDLPYSTFAYEAKRVPSPSVPQFKAVVPPSSDDDEYAEVRHTAQVDLEELGKALGTTPLDADQQQQVLASYSAVRQALTAHAEAMAAWKEVQQVALVRRKGPVPEPPIAPELKVPDNLPGEFADYLRGAIAYHQNQSDQARQAWSALLQRPAGERHYRSTWAAFMIGRSLLENNPQEAYNHFRQVRDLASQGYADSLGLASATFGWEGQAELKQGHFAKALELFRVQLEAGEPSAIGSLLFTARHAATEAPPEARAECIRSVTARRLIAAYLVSASFLKGDPRVAEWLNSFKAAETPLEEVERLAWAAYQAGQADLSRAWLEKAPATSPIAQWLRAKLLLREGNITGALPLISEVARHFSGDGDFLIARDNECEVFDNRRAWAEVGGLLLARSEYIAALDALLQGVEIIQCENGGGLRYWEDAAYVAEQVLSLQELKKFVDQRWPRPSQVSPDGKEAHPGDQMRYLLARRLAREGRLAEALPYFPVKWQNSIRRYDELLQQGRDEKLPGPQRAEALWSAAQLARRHGMELLGTGVDPDWAEVDGTFDFGNTATQRPKAGVNKASSEELERAGRNRPQPDQRFHYRYIAADLGWDAAQLMPDNSDQTALTLATAGTWLKNIDVRGADRFYKALVHRCGKTELGEMARNTRWFPPLPATADSTPEEGAL